MSKARNKLRMWLITPSVPDRSGWERALRRIVRRRPARQGVFAFVDRARRLDHLFKIVITGTILSLVAILLASLPTGRYLADLLSTRGRWLALRAIGLEPDRTEINAYQRRKRNYDIDSARAQFVRTFAEYDAPQQRLLRFAGMDPENVLLRWGDFDRTLMLPSAVFESDGSGRSYRLRPNVRSIWIRNFPTRGAAKAYFPIPDSPEAAGVVQRSDATIVAGSAQTTNSWGLRGPEADLSAPYRGIVLGDSYMQGLYVGDDQTPTECLKRDLRKRLGAPVEILNTGHLGYSPEQYYFTLVEYAERFPPRFVVVSLFANDFARDMYDVLEGRGGDWEEGKYWLGSIRQFCSARGVVCLYVPAPWVNQLYGSQMAGFYPGPISNILGTSGFDYLDPIDEFANARLAISIEGPRQGVPPSEDPLFNGRIGDGHFSALGCEVWAEAVGRRLALLLGKKLAETGRLPPGVRVSRESGSHPPGDGAALP